jgi:hypothetical protein
MLNIGKYQVCILDLFTDRDGKLSASKLWLHIGNVIMSKVMLTQQEVGWELLAAYGTVVGGSHIGAVWLRSKYGSANADIGMDTK